MLRSASQYVLATALAFGGAAFAVACPFCDVTSQTLSEEIESSDAAVLAKLILPGMLPDRDADELDDWNEDEIDNGDAVFEIVEVLRGPDSLRAGQSLKTVYFGVPNETNMFYVTGIDGETVEWMTPLVLSPAAVDYVRRLTKLPTSGADRLAFFQEYFEHDDPLLAQDAYEEFARAPYSEVKELGDRMHHDRLVSWITDPEVNPSRRRLYLTMLSVCGSAADLPLLEEMITSDYQYKKQLVEQIVATSTALGGPIGTPMLAEMVKLDERRKKLGLDAMVACYLTLRGPEGLDVIDQRFLLNPNAEYTYVYSTIMALRFHAEETGVVPHERLLESMRLLLDNSDYADQIVPDLSRMEDWSVLDRLVDMFKDSSSDTFIRPPVVAYLTVASSQPGEVGRRATAALAELEQLDPETVKRSQRLMAFGVLARGRTTSDASTVAEADDSEVEPMSIDDLPDDETTATDPADSPAAEPTTDETSSENSPMATGSATDENTDEISVTAAPERLQHPSRLMIVGVPLVAGAFLMGIYWVILRGGSA